MKKTSLVLVLVLSVIISTAQTWTNVNGRWGYEWLRVPKALFIPSGSGAPSGTASLNGAMYKGQAALFSDTTNKKLYLFNPKDSTWTDVTGGGGGSVTSVSGTTNRTTVTNPTTTPVVDISSSYIGQASITTLGTIGTGVWNGTGIGSLYGGTGQTSVTTGDLLYGSATNTWARLPGVATGNALISGGVGTAFAWGKIGLTTHVSGILPIANGGTGTATPGLVAGTNTTITGTWPNQTINSTGGGGGSPAGSDREIQINNSGVFGAVSGVKITTDKTIVADSVRIKQVVIDGDTTVTSKIVFSPKKSRPGPMPWRIGLDEQNNQYDGGATIDPVFEIKYGALDGTGRYFRTGWEGSWLPFPGATYQQAEMHVLEMGYGPGLGNLVVRPLAWTGSWSGNDGTWTHRANLHSFYDWNGHFDLGGFSKGVGEFKAYHNISGNGLIKLTVCDTTFATGNTIAAGMIINGQIAGGNRTNQTSIYGQTIDYTWETAPIFHATAPGANSSNFNYVLDIPSSNTGHRFIVNKGSGVFDDVAMWIHNDGRTVIGDAYNFWPSYKLQAHNGSNSFVFGEWDTDNSTILYSGAFSHRLTSGAGAAGIGAGYRFEADNASNTQTIIGDIAGVLTNVTAGVENGDLLFRTRRAGTLTEALKILSTGAIKFNNAFTFPASDGTSGQVLQTNGSGSVAWATPSGGVSSLNSQTGAVTITAGTAITTSTLSGDITVAVDVNNSTLPHTIATYFTDAPNSGTSETDLYTTTTAANTLSSNGQTLYFDYTINVSDVTATADLAVYFGATQIGNTGALTVSSTGTWHVTGSITRATTTTARATVAVNSPGASTASYTNETDLTSQDFTTTNVVKITGQAGGTGGGSGDITAKMGKLYYQP